MSSVRLVDVPSGLNRGLNLDRIVKIVKVNGSVLCQIKWEGFDDLEYVYLYDLVKNENRLIEKFEECQLYFFYFSYNNCIL